MAAELPPTATSCVPVEVMPLSKRDAPRFCCVQVTPSELVKMPSPTATSSEPVQTRPERTGPARLAGPRAVHVTPSELLTMISPPIQPLGRVVRYAMSQGLGRFAALVPANSFGQRVSQDVSTAAARASGAVRSLTRFEETIASGEYPKISGNLGCT